MLKDVIEVLRLKDKVRDEICLAMRRRVKLFKELLTSDKYSNHPEFEYIKGQDYGCKDDKLYYCLLPERVHFIYKNSQWSSNRVIFDDELKYWMVYDNDKKKDVVFEALNTDAQIAILKMLDTFIDHSHWSSY
jgi:hypothetical protein